MTKTKTKKMKALPTTKTEHEHTRVNSVIDVRDARPGDLVFPGRERVPNSPVYAWLILGTVPGPGKSPDNDVLVYWEFRTRSLSSTLAPSSSLMRTEFKWMIGFNSETYPLYVFGEVS